jgi:hypothetical protein
MVRALPGANAGAQIRDFLLECTASSLDDDHK